MYNHPDNIGRYQTLPIVIQIPLVDLSFYLLSSRYHWYTSDHFTYRHPVPTGRPQTLPVVIQILPFWLGGAVAWWLTPRTPRPEVGVRALLGSPCCVLEKDIFTPPKVLIIPNKRWLRLNMTEKLFTGTLSIKTYKTTFWL